MWVVPYTLGLQLEQAGLICAGVDSDFYFGAFECVANLSKFLEHEFLPAEQIRHSSRNGCQAWPAIRRCSSATR